MAEGSQRHQRQPHVPKESTTDLRTAPVSPLASGRSQCSIPVCHSLGKCWPCRAQFKAGFSSSLILLEDLFCFKLCVCMCSPPPHTYTSCMCRYLRRSEESPQLPGAGANSSEPLDVSAGNCTLNCSGFSPALPILLFSGSSAQTRL